jgi:RES domain-containing protein
MRLWRITSARWALDRICAGARDDGGRWNPLGMAAMYAGTTVEICALEKFVHLAGVDHAPLKLVAIDIPDDPELVYTPRRSQLPDDWSALPVAAGSQQFGAKWLSGATHLVMLIPSAIVPEAQNAVINPAHPAYSQVALKVVRDFSFDARMFKA